MSNCLWLIFSSSKVYISFLVYRKWCCLGTFTASNSLDIWRTLALKDAILHKRLIARNIRKLDSTDPNLELMKSRNFLGVSNNNEKIYLRLIQVICSSVFHHFITLGTPAKEHSSLSLNTTYKEESKSRKHYPCPMLTNLFQDQKTSNHLFSPLILVHHCEMEKFTTSKVQTLKILIWDHNVCGDRSSLNENSLATAALRKQEIE